MWLYGVLQPFLWDLLEVYSCCSDERHLARSVCYVYGHAQAKA